MKPRYPSYKSFDPFVDIDRLKSLDEFMASRIAVHIKARQDSYFLNQHRLDEQSPYVPGVREIWLTQTIPGREYDYLDLDRPEFWQPTDMAGEFEPVMQFIQTLPFAATGRILIIYDDGGNAVPAHRDHLETDRCNEFIWMRTNFIKRFFMMNGESGEKLYVSSHTAWFDTVNQFHGADSCEGLSFSLRVDGVFEENFRKRIPYPATCRSAAPSLWAEKDQTLQTESRGWRPADFRGPAACLRQHPTQS